MKKELLLFALITSAALTAAAQSQIPTNGRINNDTLPVERLNEVGILVGGFHFNSFAPEYYLGTFNLNLSSGVVYKHKFGNSSLRVGYAYSMMNMHNAGGQWTDENAISGKETGNMLFAGAQHTFFSKGIFQFYAGVDLAAAVYSFNGYSVNYYQTNTATEQKKMNGVGINPLLGCSFQVTPRVKISAESNFDSWFIKQRTYVPDPGKYVTTQHFTCAPNPISGLYVSMLF